MTEPDPDRLDGLAAEYVLGTLRGPARARFERLIESDPALAQRVDAWAKRLDPLAEAAPAIEPPARSWTAIEQRIGAAAAKPVRARGCQARRRARRWEAARRASSRCWARISH